MKSAVKLLYVDLPTTAVITALSESSIQRLVREGDFPKPRQLGPRRVAWLMREVEAWAEERPVSNLLPPENTSRRNDNSPPSVSIEES